MALPTSRDLTVVDGASKVDASLLNNIQDCIIGGKHGSIVVPLHCSIFHPSQWTGTPTQVGNGAVTYWWTSGGTAYYLASLRVPVGSRITRVRAFTQSAAGSACELELYRYSTAGVRTQIGATITGALGLGPATLDLTGLNETVAANVSYAMEVEVGGTDERLYMAEYTYEKL
jgi:hypothetical protein